MLSMRKASVGPWFGAGGFISGLIGGRGLEKWMMATGILVLAGILGVTFLADYISPFNPEIGVGPSLEPPNGTYLMGTDKLGRDVYSRVIHGSKIVMQVAGFSSLLSIAVGVPLGLASGYAAGKLDRTISLIMDSIYSFPGLILAIAIAAVLGPGVVNMAVAIAAVYIPSYFRMVRGEVLTVKELPYVEAARGLGAKTRTIIGRYILPNIIPSIAVVLSINFADAILTEAGLSFVGLGISPPTPDWGFDLSNGRPYLASKIWWLITYPGLMIVITVLGFTLLGEGLNEYLNPRLRERA